MYLYILIIYTCIMDYVENTICSLFKFEKYEKRIGKIKLNYIIQLKKYLIK